jgi:uncharacterized protein (TIGR02453 family)
VDDFPLPPFDGFRPAALGFLRGLAANNERAWWAEHKAEYENDLRLPFAALLATLTEQLAKAKLPLRGDPFGAQFRLHRDVRFSGDKRPFKTNAGAVLTRDGSKRSQGLLYVHLDPEGCFTAAGFWHPEPPQLAAMRGAVAGDAAGWGKVMRALDKSGLALDREEALSRPPKGFDGAPAAVIEDLKLKNWVVRRPLAARAIGKPALVDEIMGLALAAAPLLRFGWAALEGVPEVARRR